MVNKEKMNIYIDSNIWLGLYDFSNNGLHEFNKLKSQSVDIYLPRQTRDEVSRNRINKISNARKQFEQINFSHKIPNLYKEFEADTKEFYKLNSELRDFFDIWKEKVTQAITEKTLLADTVISDLFEMSIDVPTEIYYDVAIKRMNIGNPPGKDSSYGDAINWEALLDKVPNTNDLYIITDDTDYYDDKKNETVNSFLFDEWQQKKEGNIHVFNSLVSFFDKHLSIIKLKEEETKNKLIESLEQSESFYSTHSAITNLNGYLSSFSDEEKERLIYAGCENGQVGSILEDQDLKEFYCSLIERSIDEPLDCDILSDFKKIE